MRENLDYQNFTDESKKEKAHVIANRIEDQFKQFNIPFGLVMLGSNVYGDKEKRDNVQDADFVVVLDKWNSLNTVYNNQAALNSCGLEIPNLFPEDMKLLSANPDLLVRMSGNFRDFQLKTTLNYATLAQLSRLTQPFPYHTRKIAHGKSVPYGLGRSIMGTSVYMETVTSDISNLYDDKYGISHYLQGDKNFYVTKNGDVVLGILSDSLLTGKVLKDFPTEDITTTQTKLRKQLLRAMYYRMVLDANENGEDIYKVKDMFLSGNIDFTQGLKKWDKFSPEYKSVLQGEMLALVNSVIASIDPAKIVASRKPALRRMVERACIDSPDGKVQTYDYEDLISNNSTKIGFSQVDIFPQITDGQNTQKVKSILNTALSDASHNFEVIGYEPTAVPTSVNSYTGKILGNDGNYYFLKVPKSKDSSLLSETDAKDKFKPHINVEFPRLILSANDAVVGFYPWHDERTLNQMLASVDVDSPEYKMLWETIKRRNDGFVGLFIDTAKKTSGSSHNEASVHNLYHRRLLSRPPEWYSKKIFDIDGSPINFDNLCKKEIIVNGQSCGKFGQIHNDAMNALNPYNYTQTVVSLGVGDMHGNNTFIGDKGPIEFDYGNSNYHWPWLDIAKDLHINTFLDYLIDADIFDDSDIHATSNEDALNINIQFSTVGNKRKYFENQINDLLIPTITKLKDKGFKPSEWSKIMNAALYTNYLYTRNLSEVDQKVALASLGIGCYFGSRINATEQDSLKTLTDFTSMVSKK